jgi:hypothetical protein
MRRLVYAAAAGLLAALVAGAGEVGAAGTGNKPDLVLSTRLPILELAADGKGVAVMTAARSDEHDVTTVVNGWAAPGRKRVKFVIPRDDCYHGCGELAVAGNAVAWVEGTGGNSLQLYLVRAKLSSGRLEEGDEADNGAGAGEDPEGQWLGEVFGGGSLLAYNRWEETCTDTLEPGQGCSHWKTDDRKIVRLASGGPVVVATGPDVCPVAAVGGGWIAVATVEDMERDAVIDWAPGQGNDCDYGSSGPAGDVVVFAPSGARTATIPAAGDHLPAGIALSRTRLAILRSATLDLYDPGTGAKTKTIRLGAAAAGLDLGGVTSKLALLKGAYDLVLVRLSDGKRVSVPIRRGADTMVDAKLTDAGLFYAFDVLHGSAKGRIVFEPMAKLLARF